MGGSSLFLTLLHSDGLRVEQVMAGYAGRARGCPAGCGTS